MLRVDIVLPLIFCSTGMGFLTILTVGLAAVEKEAVELNVSASVVAVILLW